MHVVHLEDESPLQEILKVALVAAEPNITLQQFINSDKAMDYIRENAKDINLYILDVRVPGSLDGIEVAKEIRELDKDGIVIVTSAYRAPDRKLLKEMNCEWFAKPWHIMQVLDTLLPRARENKAE